MTARLIRQVCRTFGSCLLACLFASLLTGCDTSLGESLAILSGTLSWARGQWQSATVSFLRAADGTGDGRIRDYALYGLSSTYLAEEEYDSALSRLSGISASADAHVRASALYQAGIVAYRREEYSKAADLFRASLEIDGQSLDAKINLELSRRSERTAQRSQARSRSAVSESRENAQGEQLIFDLVRKKEQDQWKNRESADAGPAAADH